MRCTDARPGERCPKRARCARAAGQHVCHEHALDHVRAGGLTALRAGDRARFLADSAGYAGGWTAEGS